MSNLATAPLGVIPPKEPVRQDLITLDTYAPAAVRLQAGELYTAESIETVLIRQALKEYDEHLVWSGNLSLIEWLLYTIHRQSKSISLFALKLTPLGLWHQTCKGLPAVTISINPTTGALMEWFDADRKSQVGIVAQVAPNNAVTLQTISAVPSGTFQEHVWLESQWKALGPVFTRF